MCSAGQWIQIVHVCFYVCVCKRVDMCTFLLQSRWNMAAMWCELRSKTGNDFGLSDFPFFAKCGAGTGTAIKRDTNFKSQFEISSQNLRIKSVKSTTNLNVIVWWTLWNHYHIKIDERRWPPSWNFAYLNYRLWLIRWLEIQWLLDFNGFQWISSAALVNYLDLIFLHSNITKSLEFCFVISWNRELYDK